VRRHDYLVNVLQRSVESLLFYHPAVWWLSGQIRAEREMCCDDLAVAVHGDALTYARALTELESSRRAHANAVLAANGTSLVARITRLLGQGHSIAHVLPGPGAVVMMSVLWLVGIVALAAHGASTASPAPRPLAVHAQEPLQSIDKTQTLLSAVLFGPIGPAPVAQSQQPSMPGAPIAGAPGTTSELSVEDTQQPPRTGTGVIRGRIVRTDNGQPLRKVRVSLLAEGVRDLPVATTGADGRYELTKLPPGRFTLTASKGGFVTLAYGQLHPDEQGRPIDLADRQTVDRVDLALPSGAAISGVVLDAEGQPLAGIAVHALRQQFHDGRSVPRIDEPVTVDLTDDRGQFRLFGLPPGTYYVSAVAEPLTSGPGIMLLIPPSPLRDMRFYPGTRDQSEAAGVTVDAGQEIDDLSFPLTRSGTASR
jgi:Carboxypeptidase regulatory-like domain/BlaR1 peptidase M56